MCTECSTDLNKHLVAHWGLGGFGRGAVDRHGLPVTRELQSELLFHQLLHHLRDREETIMHF